MYFRLTKHVHIHTGCLILLGFSFFSSGGAFFRCMLLFAVLHELFHLATALSLRIPILHLSFLPYGCHLSLGKTDFLSETAVAAAGPLGSFLLFLLCQDKEIGTINLYLCLLNLLPALPLDGGRLLRLMLWKTAGFRRGNRFLRFTGFCIGFLFLCHALFSRSFPFAYIAFLLFSHTKNVPIPFHYKKTVHTPVRLYAVRRVDSLRLLFQLYSPFYTLLFYIQDTESFVSEQATLSALSQNAAATFADVPQRSSQLS